MSQHADLNNARVARKFNSFALVPSAFLTNSLTKLNKSAQLKRVASPCLSLPLGVKKGREPETRPCIHETPNHHERSFINDSNRKQ